MDTKKLIDTMTGSYVFRRFSDGQCLVLLEAFGAECKDFEKDEAIYQEDDEITKFGLVVEGVVKSSKVSIEGRESITQFCRPRHFFGIEFAASSSKRSLFTYECVEKASVQFYDYQRLLRSGIDASLKEAVLANTVDLLTQRTRKNFERMEILEQNSIRQRILLYLKVMSRRKEKNQFVVCMNREEMAAYLSVNRSALSSELGKMRDEGLIDYHKNDFKLLKNP